jgi:hypothetical protein
MEGYMDTLIGLAVTCVVLLSGNLVLRVLEYLDQKQLNAAAMVNWKWSRLSAQASIEDREYEREVRDSVPLEMRQQVSQLTAERKVAENLKTLEVIDAINDGKVKLSFEEE